MPAPRRRFAGRRGDVGRLYRAGRHGGNNLVEEPYPQQRRDYRQSASRTGDLSTVSLITSEIGLSGRSSVPETTPELPRFQAFRSTRKHTKSALAAPRTAKSGHLPGTFDARL